MSKQFILITPNEDGDCVRILNKEDLETLLSNPSLEYGVETFLNEKDLKTQGTNPMMWTDPFG